MEADGTELASAVILKPQGKSIMACFEWQVNIIELPEAVFLMARLWDFIGVLEYYRF